MRRRQGNVLSSVGKHSSMSGFGRDSRHEKQILSMIGIDSGAGEEKYD